MIEKDDMPIDIIRFIEDKYKGFLPYVLIGMCGPHPRFGLPDGWKWDAKK